VVEKNSQHSDGLVGNRIIGLSVVGVKVRGSIGAAAEARVQWQRGRPERGGRSRGLP